MCVRVADIRADRSATVAIDDARQPALDLAPRVVPGDLDEGAAIRRRRSCTDCGFRFTTYERLENAPLFVIKRNGNRQPFDRAKVAAGIQAAVKGRPVEDIDIMAMVERIEDKLRLVGGDVTTSDVGHSVLDELRATDEVAYMRFASVYKNFDDAADFRRELALLQKRATRD
ncbi:MAG: transcriptional regulator NrdR [Actinomycetota bacterium]